MCIGICFVCIYCGCCSVFQNLVVIFTMIFAVRCEHVVLIYLSCIVCVLCVERGLDPPPKTGENLKGKKRLTKFG